MTPDITQGLLFVLNIAVRRGLWIVAVVPSNTVAAHLRTLSALSPPGRFSGRTALLDSGKVTLVGARESPFEGKYHSTFLGWGSLETDSDKKGMSKWRESAISVVQMFL